MVTRFTSPLIRPYSCGGWGGILDSNDWGRSLVFSGVYPKHLASRSSLLVVISSPGCIRGMSGFGMSS